MRKSLGILVLCLLGLIPSSVRASGCEFHDALEIDVDFGFHIAGQKFPPGQYTIVRGSEVHLNPLRIVKRGTNAGTIFDVTDLTGGPLPTETHVVFSIVDDRYILAEIWMDRKEVGCKVVQEHEHKPHHGKKKVGGEHKSDK